MKDLLIVDGYNIIFAWDELKSWQPNRWTTRGRS